MIKMRPFQIGLLAAFAILGVTSVVMLASFNGFISGGENPYGNKVVIWGTLDKVVMLSTIQDVRNEDDNFKVVDYLQKDSRTFEEELVNAIAEGRQPDAIVLASDDLVTYRAKLLPIPYESFTKRTLQDSYVDGAEIFARNDGLYAVPFLVDPMVMYWNRDLFSSGAVAIPPATWDALTDTVQKLTLRNATRDIIQSTVAFGEFSNVQHAKEMLVTLLMQSGSQMVKESKEGYKVVLDQAQTQDARQPLNAALQFFTEFSNANSPLYSWNRSQQDDLTAFLAEDLALYFGYGSELNKIRELNPNFNFDVASVPQGSGATIYRVYGKFYGLAILKSSSNPQGTYLAVQKLASPETVSTISQSLSLAPVHRATIASGTANAYWQTIFSSALVARGWLDPDKGESNTIMKQMVEDVVSNRQKVSGAVSDAVRRIELAF